MKFPNSPHAEGWMSHIENAQSTATPGAATAGVSRAKPKIGIGPKGPGRRLSASELRFDTAAPAAAAGIPDATAMPGATLRPTASASGASSASLPRRSSSSLPWIIGAGVGVALIAGAVVMSRHTTPTTTPDSVPMVVGQADTQPKASPSAEDAQLAAAPSGAGPDSAQTADAAPVTAATPAPATEPATKVAEATPAPMFTKTTPAANATPAVTAKAAAPAPQSNAVARADAAREPAVRTLSAPSETVAQATPPAATLAPPTTLAQAAQPAVPPAITADTQPAVQPTTPVTTASADPAVTAPAPAAPTATAPVPATPGATADANATPPLAQAAPSPAPAAAEDAGITVKVRSALVADAVLSGVPISVTTNNGVVKLEGQAPDAQAREHATAVVASTVGVKGVDNRLTVPPVAQLQLSPMAQGS